MITYGLLTEEIGKGLLLRALAAHRARHGGPCHPALGERGAEAALPAGDGARRDPRRPRPLRARGRQRRQERARRRPSDAGDAWVLDGRKKWTTFGQLAGLFLVLAQADGKPTAFLVERETPGVAVRPLHGIIGTRASMLAEIFFDGCRVPKENLLGRPGFGVSHVISAALEHGRYSVAWGSRRPRPGLPRRLPCLRRRAPAVRRPDRRPPAHPPHADQHDRRGARRPPALPARRLAARRRRSRRLRRDHGRQVLRLDHGDPRRQRRRPDPRRQRLQRGLSRRPLPARLPGAWRSSRGARRSSRSPSRSSSCRSFEMADEKFQTTPPPSTRRRRKRSSRSSAWSGTSTTPSGTASCSRTPR